MPSKRRPARSIGISARLNGFSLRSKATRILSVSAYGKVDRALRTELGRIKPDFPIAVDGQPKPKGSCFVVAPIDGLNNFAHGIPQFAISVAVFENGAVTAAIVYNPGFG